MLILICSGICTGLTHVVRATLSTAYGTSRRRWHCQCASLASLWLRPLALQAEDVQNDGVGTPTGWYVSATYLLAGALGTRRRYSTVPWSGARRARSSNRPARSCRGAHCTPLEPIVRANSSGMYRRHVCMLCALRARWYVQCACALPPRGRQAALCAPLEGAVRVRNVTALKSQRTTHKRASGRSRQSTQRATHGVHHIAQRVCEEPGRTRVLD